MTSKNKSDLFILLTFLSIFILGLFYQFSGAKATMAQVHQVWEAQAPLFETIRAVAIVFIAFFYGMSRYWEGRRDEEKRRLT